MLQDLLRNVEKIRNQKKSLILARFFKTGEGEYGEGDVFYGITVPQCREIALKYKNLALKDISHLIHSPVHEIRLIGLLILVQRYKNNYSKLRKEIVDFYLHYRSQINNWDLVDLSASHILGEYCYEKKKNNLILTLAHSQSLWDRRISIISTYAFIKKNQFELTFTVARLLLADKHALIHKAVGWMLREVGKRDMKVLRSFLNTYSVKMPRTMLRYAIEKMEEEERKQYLKKDRIAKN